MYEVSKKQKERIEEHRKTIERVQQGLRTYMLAVADGLEVPDGYTYNQAEGRFEQPKTDG